MIQNDYFFQTITSFVIDEETSFIIECQKPVHYKIYLVLEFLLVTFDLLEHGAIF